MGSAGSSDRTAGVINTATAPTIPATAPTIPAIQLARSKRAGAAGGIASW
jgi:hypothetical protein